MQIRFEELDYQKQAIEAVVDLFAGQEINRSEFAVVRRPIAERSGQERLDLDSFLNSQGELGLVESELGIGNRLALTNEALLENLVAVQQRNGLVPSPKLVSRDFTVEMETGTGKTYVYLRTVLELNRRYGFSKFIIVVPSIAIKEGVIKTLEMTKDHFRALYAGTPFDFYLYDSAEPGRIRNFATSSHVQIMVMTVGAINKKDFNTIYQPTEKVGGEKPIDLIKATNPIVIVDEPQSVDGGEAGRGRAALEAMSPLCTLRYSATHQTEHHMVYRLDAVDAYERRLVKQIEVAGLEAEGALNRPYVKLLSIASRRGTVTAQIEINGNSQREIAMVYGDDDLEALSQRAIYANHRIGQINARRGDQYIELRMPGTECLLRPDEAVNDLDVEQMRRQMIRRTIEEHFLKEMRLNKMGIKVLSLFFLDTVANYRAYEEDGTAQKGKYALMFEEEYRLVARQSRFSELFAGIDLVESAAAAHEGYFSIDRKQRFLDTAENNDSARENAERAYQLIMRDKEKLLSFDSSLRFIFSHSALREGWDNPNVFQICNFSVRDTERWRRQTIGRGLRICVNQSGERVYDFDVNMLTVIANESYESFAEQLQKDIEAETQIKFGLVDERQLAAISVQTAEGVQATLGVERAAELMRYLKDRELIDAAGGVSDRLADSIRDGSFQLPAPFDADVTAIGMVLLKTLRKVDLRDAGKRISIRPRQAILDSTEFRDLWDKIKYKSRYHVEFDNDRLIAEASAAIRGEAPSLGRPKIVLRRALLSFERSGIGTDETLTSHVAADEGEVDLPDILTELQDRIFLTRRSLVKILLDSASLSHFKRNPQGFIAMAARVIEEAKRKLIIDGIKYRKLGDEHFYSQELFLSKELTGYIGSVLKDAKRSAFEDVAYQSKTELRFAEELERSGLVKVYAKLPGWFVIQTPLGNYTPDWAVLIEQEGEERVYFVVETKADLSKGALRGNELNKLDCGQRHFEAIAGGNSQVRFKPASSFSGLF
jgi:type III restriction enzyme